MTDLPPPIELQGISLGELEELVKSRRLPPVEQWDPPLCGHSNMRILGDGTWLHEGDPIRRPALVRLFSTILKREPDGSHVLVTPVEKLTIDVDRTAFRAIQMASEGAGSARRVAFTLDSGDAVILGPDHPLNLAPSGSAFSPRVQVRFGLEAELTRAVFYELAELAISEGAQGIWSNGTFFSLDEAR